MRLYTLVTAAVIYFAASSANAVKFVETPVFVAKVAAGELPSVDQRLPAEPFIEKMHGGKAIGRHGGDLRTMIGRAKDIRLLVVYG